MTRFQCLGSSCESNCCHDWTIAVDKPTYDRLDRVLSAASSGPAFAEAIVRFAAPGPDLPYAAIKLTDEGRCPFLDATKLCSLQQQHGESVLSDACATYPRAALTIQDRREMGGRLSCPEVGRLALLADDGADLVATDVTIAGARFVPGKTIDTDGDAWSSAFDRVREPILASFRRTELPLSLRVAVVADLGARLAPFFTKNSPELSGAARPFAERRLDHELAQCSDISLVQTLSIGMTELDIPPGPTTNLVASVILERTRLSINKDFDAMATAALANFRGELLGADAPKDAVITADALGHLWLGRQAKLDGQYAAITERIFRNWSMLWWTQEPYTTSPSVLDHTIRFALSLAVVRFLFAGHPRVAAVLAAGSSVDDAQVELEAAAVEVARLFSRAFEHDPKFLTAIDESMRAERPHSLGRALCLARMC
jgi:hypothetical protein